MPEATFWKLCGSGTDEGFTPIPNTAVWAILVAWPDEATARRMTSDAPVFGRWRARAAEDWTVFLAPASSRGEWSGVEPFEPDGPEPLGPIAVLTRATVRPTVVPRFWGRAPAIQDVIRDDPNVAFKIGIGEVPWFQQVTFSIWPDMPSMTRFAHAPGPHADAIRAVRDGGWFREELYARFRVLGGTGTWEGASPLAQFEKEAA
ncbi:MAG: spheroidene monooxygenase [Pseudomonadota bacterium]